MPNIPHVPKNSRIKFGLWNARSVNNKAVYIFWCIYFNIRLDLISNSETDRFMNILGTFDLYQHRQNPIHSSGHTLNLVITKSSNSDSTYSTDVFSDAPSDHSYVICNVLFLASCLQSYVLPQERLDLLRLIPLLKVHKKLNLVQLLIQYILFDKYNSNLLLF